MGKEVFIMGYMENYKKWCEDTYFDEATRAELKAIEGNDKEIQERFYKDLEFGTGGLRGIIGAGTNRLNIYTVSKATQGFANYIIKQGEEAVKKGVAIAFDSRRMSPEFAEITALVLNGNGIKTYIYPSLRPTPMLSFAVRELNCTGGVVITASHNPPEYNGYKVYWADGGQVPYPRDEAIIEEVNAVTDFHTIKTANKDEAVKAGLFNVIGEEVDEAFDKNVLAQIVNPEIIKEQHDLKIVYTPIHGSGNKPVRRVLKKAGFENVTVVPEQELPDGDFPTVSYPNPEAKEAFALGLALAKEKDADLVLATDPDADRLGVYVKDAKSGEYIPLTGNMSGSLLCEYVLSQKKEKAGSLPADGAVVKSIVTTNLVDEIAKAYNVKLIEVLTGFKWIGKEILGFEQSGKGTYLFGLEESYGCLIGTYARDKDAVSATVALCEAAAYYATKGKTLWDVMIDMYEKYGYCVDSITAMDFPGLEGMDKMKAMLSNLRENPLKDIAGYKVVKIRDYSNDTILDVESGKVEPTGLPASNVLYYELEGGAWVFVRQSVTDPKIKFYYGVKASSMDDAQAESAKFAEWAKAQA